MNKIKEILIVAMLIFIICSYANANINENIPRSLRTENMQVIQNIELIPIVMTDIPNVDSLLNFEIELNKDGKVRPEIFGFAYNVDYKLQNNGIWDTLPNGDRIWRIRIRCPNAYTINLLLDSFELSQNSDIYFYSKNSNFTIGPFTSYYNKKSKKLATNLIAGDDIIIELYEPKNESNKSNFAITKIVYGYKNALADFDAYKKQFFDNQIQSGSCNVDVNCPEGDDWCREKFSVAIILAPMYYSEYGWCTGSLLNNARNDYTPYLLTAFHCLDVNPLNGVLSNAEIENLDTWSFRFSYMRGDCNYGDMITYEFSGADFKAAYNVSDFALIQLQDQPISGQQSGTQDVYFNGWDVTGSVPSSVVAMHHPAGDRMKISTKNSSPVTYDTYFWDVDWDVGTTESGSSGCPLFSHNHQIIGQNKGQIHPPILEPCDPNKITSFGKLSISWNGGGTSDTRLKDWLDPDNTGVQTLDGIKMPLLKYGWNINSGQTINWNAYDVFKIGSSYIAPFSVYSGGNLTLQSEREIIIRPCTRIIQGSTFYAHIGNITCDSIVYHSDRESTYDPNECGSLPPLASLLKENFDNPSFSNTKVTISPNPISENTKVVIELPEDDSISLMVKDIIGNALFNIICNEKFKKGEHHFTLNSSQLKSGSYMISLETSTEVISEKFIVVH